MMGDLVMLKELLLVFRSNVVVANDAAAVRLVDVVIVAVQTQLARLELLEVMDHFAAFVARRRRGLFGANQPTLQRRLSTGFLASNIRILASIVRIAKTETL